MGYPEADMKKGQNRPYREKKMVRSYGLMAVGAFVMAFRHGIRRRIRLGLYQDVWHLRRPHVGFWNWLGFVAPGPHGGAALGRKPWKLFAINAGYHFVSLTIMGLILACWSNRSREDPVPSGPEQSQNAKDPLGPGGLRGILRVQESRSDPEIAGWS